MSDESPNGTQGLRRQLMRSLLGAVGLGLGVFLLLPQLAGLRATGEAIARAPWWLPLSLVTLEAASLAAYGRLQLGLLRQTGEYVDEGFVQRSVIVGYAVGRALPGGTGTSFAIIMAAFRKQGHDLIHVGTAVWGAGVLSSCALAALLPVAAVIGLSSGHVGSVGLSVILAAIGAVGAAALMPLALHDVDAFTRRVRSLLKKLARGPLRTRLAVDTISEGVHRGLEGLRAISTDPALLRRAVAWAAANWLLDLAVVFLLALTVGRGTPLTAVPLAYVAAQLAAAIPLTPGGVGIVETAMAGALAASGSPAAPAAATVLGWRLVSHWLPIPIGLGILPTLAARP